MWLERVRDKERNNPKFSFLNPNDAYAAFYAWRLHEIKEGRGAPVPGPSGEAAPVTGEPETQQAKGPPPPEEFHFSARMPIINAQDLEVVKLTALFVAKRGKGFMTALSQKEARNFQFDFLRPQHSLYQFFTRLVDQYTILLRPEGVGDDETTTERARVAELEENIKRKDHVLGRAKRRAEWVKYQEQQKQRKEEEEEKERINYAQIDWQDFVVVETVVFTEADEQVDLPPPTTLTDLQSASLEQKAMMSLNPLRIEEAMPTDQESPVYYNAYPPPQPTTPPLQRAEQIEPPPQEQPPPAAAMPLPISVSAAAEEEEAHIRQRMEERHRAAAAKTAPQQQQQQQQQPMRIRSDYVPRAQARRQNPAATATALCPNCHQQIPVAELDQHMRIELLDPRWKEQRAKAESRSATTNLSTVDVVNNLKRFASQRSDVFDSSNVVPTPPPSAPAGESSEEDGRRKRLATTTTTAANAYGPSAPVPAPAPQAFYAPGTFPPPPGVSVGGVPPPPGTVPTVGHQPSANPPTTLNIEEQLKRLHEKYKQ